jgi:hypothetical protein
VSDSVASCALIVSTGVDFDLSLHRIFLTGGTGGKFEVLDNRGRGFLGELASIGSGLPLLTELPRRRAFPETGLPT